MNRDEGLSPLFEESDIGSDITSPETSLRNEGGIKNNNLIYKKYYDPFRYKGKGDRPVSLINNLLDNNVSEQRIGGSYSYNANSIDDVQILRSRAAFDRSLIELTLSIPHIYKTDPVQFIKEQKKKLIKIVKQETSKDKMTNFGFFIEIVLIMNKNVPGETSLHQEIFINTLRYIMHISDIDEVLELISKFLIERVNNLIMATEGSGLTIEKIYSFKMCYHKACVRNRLGYYIEFPVVRGRRLIFNPKNKDENDNTCLLKCLAAFALKLEHQKKSKQKIRWDNINRNLIKPENIKKYLKFNNLEENQFSNIKNLEKLNNFRINVYKIEKENNSNKYNIFLVQKGNKKMKNKCSIILYDYYKVNRLVTHCF